MERNPCIRPRILHVIEQLAPGGAATALVETARHLASGGQQHSVLSLVRPVAAASDYAVRAGLAVVDGGEIAADDAIDRLIAEADIVWVHAWTSPVLDAFLRRPHPPARWLIWLHVAGDSAPHMLTPSLAAFPNLLVASSPYTASLPLFASASARTAVVLAGSDLGGFAEPRIAAPGAEFRIGYIGTLDAAKMHPDFVTLSRAANLPAARFDIYGRGADEARLRAEIDASRDLRFGLRGWAADVPAALATMDAFGYPLARNSHATAELVLQEAMAAGVPPVILDHGAAVHLVDHARTGLLARDEANYPRCLERLAADPALRRRLGEAARHHALSCFGAARAARAFEPLVASLLARPRHVRAWPDRADTGADRFLAALGTAAEAFAASRNGENDAAGAAIATASPALASATSGGILHWRRYYPDDPWLRFWSGLVHRGQGRMVPALGELMRARALGIAAPGLDRHIAECVEATTRTSQGA